jgi:hypothetical protein
VLTKRRSVEHVPPLMRRVAQRWTEASLDPPSKPVGAFRSTYRNCFSGAGIWAAPPCKTRLTFDASQAALLVGCFKFKMRHANSAGRLPRLSWARVDLRCHRGGHGAGYLIALGTARICATFLLLWDTTSIRRGASCPRRTATGSSTRRHCVARLHAHRDTRMPWGQGDPM